MTDSDATKTETIWDAIFNRAINSKNLVPFCIIFAITTWGFINLEGFNKRFIINTLKEPEFAWFSFYISITLTSIGITRLCDKLGIFKAISLCPFLSDFVYWCILDYRDMKRNFENEIVEIYIKNLTQEKIKLKNYNLSVTFQFAILCLSGYPYNNSTNPKLHFNATELQKKLCKKRKFNEGTENDVLLEIYSLFIFFKNISNPKYCANKIELERLYEFLSYLGDEESIKINTKDKLESRRKLIEEAYSNECKIVEKLAIKYKIIKEEKDGTISMPRGMVRYFDIIEYGFFYEGKYPILKCILVPCYFIKNHFRLLLSLISIIISQYL